MRVSYSTLRVSSSETSARIGRSGYVEGMSGESRRPQRDRIVVRAVSSPVSIEISWSELGIGNAERDELRAALEQYCTDVLRSDDAPDSSARLVEFIALHGAGRVAELVEPSAADRSCGRKVFEHGPDRDPFVRMNVVGAEVPSREVAEGPLRPVADFVLAVRSEVRRRRHRRT